MTLPRVVLVEDNTSLQYFVRTAFEDLPITLCCCSSVDDALAALQQEPAALILSDLMMPIRSGHELVQVLAEQPELQGDAKLVIYSAGLDAATRAALNQPHVWRLLAKPCSLADLQACVSDALASAEPTCRHAAIQRNFAGDQAIYAAFRKSCIAQFAHDIATADLACEQGNTQALHHLAHSLKSVLLMLGHPDESALAAQLEREVSAPNWQALRPQLLAMR